MKSAYPFFPPLHPQATRSPLALWLLVLSLLIMSGCASTPDRAYRKNVSSSIISHALSLKGIPYRWGMETPSEGFDCSGFVQYVYGRHGIRLPRTAHDMAVALPSISTRERRPGDLLFFNTTGRTYSHVGIYLGNDSFVHASSSKARVTVSSLGEFWWRRLTGVRRPSGKG